jgi:hypothetical protein
MLYLAVPTDTYQTFFTLPFVQSVIASQHIHLIVYDVKREVIVKWHEQKNMRNT